MRAVVDVTLNLSLFKNIYIKQQAFFQLMFKVYYVKNGEVSNFTFQTL